MADTVLQDCVVGPSRFCPGLVSVAFWRGEVETHGADLCAALDGDLPSSGRQATSWQSGYIYRVARDRLLIRSDNDANLIGRVRSFLTGNQAAISDLLYAWKVIDLTGPAVPSVIAQCLPINGSDTSLPVGEFVQSFLQDSVVLLHRKAEQEFSVMVPTSFSEAISDRLVKISEKII